MRSVCPWLYFQLVTIRVLRCSSASSCSTTILNTGLISPSSTASKISLICVSPGIFSIPYTCFRFSSFARRSSNSSIELSFNENMANPDINASIILMLVLADRLSFTRLNPTRMVSNSPLAENIVLFSIRPSLHLLSCCPFYSSCVIISLDSTSSFSLSAKPGIAARRASPGSDGGRRKDIVHVPACWLMC